jgi:hypothetical protein
MHLHLDSERYMWAQTLKIGVYACIQHEPTNISYNLHIGKNLSSRSNFERKLQKLLALINLSGFVDVLRVCSGLWI